MTTHFDIYYRVALDPAGINVTKGYYPFIEGQKFIRGSLKLKVLSFNFSEYRSIFHNEKLITSVNFDTVSKPVPILQVLKSIAEGRTKFSK